jgi:hypothetical protein
MAGFIPAIFFLGLLCGRDPLLAIEFAVFLIAHNSSYRNDGRGHFDSVLFWGYLVSIDQVFQSPLLMTEFADGRPLYLLF